MNIKQRKILHLLSIGNGRRYSDLYKNFSEEDKFPYHIKQLIHKGLVNKRNNRYFLTRIGAQSTQDFSSINFEERRLKIPINLFVCKFQDKYLIRKIFTEDTTVETFYALPGIKAEWGVRYDEVFSSLFPQKFEVSGRISYRSTFHLLEYTTKDQVMFDDLLIIFDVEIQQIHNIDKNSTWLTIEQIKQLENTHKPIDLFILNNNREHFGEIVISSNFNLKEEDL